MNGRSGPKAASQVSDASQDQDNRSPTLCRAALTYVRHGWRVLPLHHWTGTSCTCGKANCTSPGKHPRTVNGVKDATTDPATIRGWWRRWPDANVGLATGFAFDVFDLDIPEALATAARLDCGPDDDDGDPRPWRYGQVAETGRGWHLMMLPTGLGNRSKFVPGCDWRGRGGYIVAPPSLHPSGRRCRLLTRPGTPLRPLPGWLADLLAPARQPTMAVTTLGRPRGTAIASGDRRAAYDARALDAEAGRVALAPEGSRNHQLNRSAHSLGQLVGGGVLVAGEVVARLLAADAVRGGRPEAEARRTIASGLRAGVRKPRNVPA